MVRPRVVVLERQAEELVAQRVAPHALLDRETGAGQRRQRAVHGRLRARHLAGQLLEAGAVGAPRQRDEHREHAVRPDDAVRPGRARWVTGHGERLPRVPTGRKSF